MPNRSIERYKLYMYMGALFNTAIVWLQNGTKESEEEMADMFYKTRGIYDMRGESE